MDTQTASPPELDTYVLDDRNGPRTITARKLGESSSHREGKRRWFEVALYKTQTGMYVVHTRGVTTVPGEVTYCRVAQTPSSFEVIELLRDGRPNANSYIPRDSQRAVAQAAQWDDDLMERYRDLMEVS